MRNSKILFLTLCVLPILVLSACSSNSGKTLTYWSMWEKGDPQQKVIKKIIDEYEEENPDINIDITWMGRDLLSKTRNAVLSDDAPDLIDKEGSEIKGALGSRDLIEPLNDLLEKEIQDEDEIFKDVFTPGLLEMYESNDDDTYFIPYELISSGIFYNDQMFDELDVSAPKTWDEFISMSKDIKEQGTPPLALDGSVDFYGAYYFYWLSTRINGPGMLNEAAADETGEMWDEPGFLEAAQKVEELAKLDLFKDGYTGSQFPTQRDEWAEGKIAMLIEGTWIPGSTQELTSEDEDFKYRLFPFPQYEDNEEYYNSVEADLIGWTAPQGANMELVEDFLTFAMKKDFQEGIVTESKNISTREDLSTPEELNDFEEILADEPEFHEIYDGLRSDYPVWWETVFLPLDNKLIFGEVTAEEFIAEIQKESREFWESN